MFYQSPPPGKLSPQLFQDPKCAQNGISSVKENFIIVLGVWVVWGSKKIAFLWGVPGMWGVVYCNNWRHPICHPHINLSGGRKPEKKICSCVHFRDHCEILTLLAFPSRNKILKRVSFFYLFFLGKMHSA